MDQVQAKLGIQPLSFESGPGQDAEAPLPQPPVLSTVQLITKQGRTLAITTEGFQWLCQIKTKVRVATVCGPPHTAKSSLLNDLCGESRFSISPSLDAFTEGVWATTAFDCILLGDLYLDTQGLVPGHDPLAALLLIISSLLIYNSIGAIDKTAVAHLSLFANARNWIRVDTQNENLYQFCAGFRRMAPDYVWVLRDFTMGLAGSAREYMETVLQMAEQLPDFMQCKELLFNLFPTRDCLQFPTSDLSDPLYLSSLASLKQSITISSHKSLNDFSITGPILARIIQGALSAVNQREQIDLMKIYEEIGEERYTEVLELLKRTYLVQRQMELGEMPYEEAELALRLFKARTRTLKIVSTSHLTDPSLLSDTMDDFNQFTMENEQFSFEANSTASLAFNLRLLEQIFSPIFTSGKDTELDWIHATQKYEQDAIGPARLKALLEFMETHPFPTDISNMESLITKLRADLQNALSRDLKISKRLSELQRQPSNQSSLADAKELIKALGSRLDVPEPDSGDTSAHLENIYIKLRAIQQDSSTRNPDREPPPPPRDSIPQPPVTTNTQKTLKTDPEKKGTHCKCGMF